MVISIKSNKKHKVNIEERNKIKFNVRLIVMGCVFSLLFLVVLIHLTYIIFTKGEEYKKAAHSQQTKSQIISPSRGTIYDTNGEILASSVMVDTVSFNPGNVKYGNGKEVEEDVLAKKFSELFEITYEDALSKVHSESSVVVIARKVDKSVVEQLQIWMDENNITTGINIDSDTKRNYPNGSLASTLIGFCGTDNDGRAGIEQKWNEVLTGTAGKRTVTLDVNGDAISDGIEEYVAAENGSNIYLTIDSKIQGICETYIEQAVNDENADAGGVILMNPQTGDILAMANYPDYDLNDPFNIEATGLSDEWDTLTQEEKNNAYYALWRNKNVTDLYEPGSTFKIIMSSIGLEEELVQTNTENDFFCEGSYVVAENEDAIDCWSPRAHGYLTLTGALENSCNPAFMQLGQRIGVNKMYKYFKAYGLFDKVGTDIARVENSIFYEEDDVGPIELATMSFGQRFSITPLQLITAVSAIANDGVLVTPKIVKQIENVDTGSITTLETEEVRQVISAETAAQVKSMMKSVVVNGTGKYAAVEGYEIGGKSGTSEPPKAKEEEGYVASFIAISPIENTQVVCLVILYDPKGDSHQGGTICGPVASDILSEVLPYMGMTSSVSDNIVTDDKNAVSDVKGLSVKDARTKLENAGYTVVVSVEDESTSIVADQMPKSGVYLDSGSKVFLYTSENEVRSSISVPNVKGLSIEDAKAKLKQENLNVIIEGTRGIIVSQSISAGNQVEAGTVINLVAKEELQGGQ